MLLFSLSIVSYLSIELNLSNRNFDSKFLIFYLINTFNIAPDFCCFTKVLCCFHDMFKLMPKKVKSKINQFFSLVQRSPPYGPISQAN